MTVSSATSASTTFASTSPTAVAGTPRSFSFDPTTKVFTLSYSTNTRIAAPTQIFVPVRDQYGGRYSVTVSGPVRVISAANASQLVLQNTGAGAVTVRVSA